MVHRGGLRSDEGEKERERKRKGGREIVKGMERRRRVLEALLKRTNRSPLPLVSVSL